MVFASKFKFFFDQNLDFVLGTVLQKATKNLKAKLAQDRTANGQNQLNGAQAQLSHTGQVKDIHPYHIAAELEQVEDAEREKRYREGHDENHAAPRFSVAFDSQAVRLLAELKKNLKNISGT